MLTQEQRTLISHLLYCRGHALVTFHGDDKVTYLSRLPGETATQVTEDVSKYIPDIEGLDIYLIQGKVYIEQERYLTEEAQAYAKKRSIKLDWTTIFSKERMRVAIL